MTTRVGVIVNPTAGRSLGASFGAEALRLCRAADVDVVDLSGDSAEAAESAARTALASGAIDALVVCGGDGAVHLGLNVCSGTPVPLGIVATGTGNDLAQTLGLPVRDPLGAVRIALGGHVRSVDAVRTIDGNGRERWYGGVLAAGFDAIVNERANGWRWPKGPRRYDLAVARELPAFRAIPYRLTLDGHEESVDAMLVAVGNAPAYGGGMRVTPDALIDDGLVDVLLLREVSRLELLRVFPQVRSGGHVTHPAVEIRRARTVTLEAPGIVAYADGERLGPLPMRLEVVPGALRVLTPALP